MVGIPLTTQVPGDTPVAGSPVVVIPAQRELPPMGSNTIGPFKVNGWPAKAYEVDLKMVSSAVNSLEIKENKQEAVVNSSIEEIKLTDKEKRRLLSEYGKIEKFISAFSEGESRYKDIVRELVSYIFKNKKMIFGAGRKSLENWSIYIRELLKI